MAGFIFGGDTGLTYEGLQRRRKIAEQLMQGNNQPRNAIEGLGSAAESIAGALMGRKLDKQEGKMRDDFNSEFAGLFGGGFGGGQATPASYTAPREPSGGMDAYRNAIASIESAGSGDYEAIGPTNERLGRALGRYQIMEANIGPWSREALGREVSPDEFLANPELQDAIFDHKFGGYVQQYGPEGAAQAWFAGPGGVGKMDRKDVLGTSVSDYTQKFSNALGGAPSGGGNNMQRIAQIMAMAENPMATPAQKAIAQTLLQREMQAGDPMRQMEMERAQLELEALRNPQPDMTSGQREYQMAVDQGYQGTFMDYKQAIAEATRAQTNVNVNTGDGDPRPELLGTQGLVAIPDPTVPQGYRIEPAPGSPIAIDRAELEEKEKGREAQTRRAGSTVVQDLQRAIDLLPELSAISQGEGVVGGVARTNSAKVPGTIANRITQFTESALSNVGLDTLQQMRENSPTGGALGQVPIQQQQRLEQVLGSLSINQPPSVLEANIKRVMNIYTDIMHGDAQERARAVAEGRLSPEENAQIDGYYHELPFDERGRPVDPNSPPPTPGASGGASQDFSQMSIADIGQVDVMSLTPEQMDAFDARMKELGL